MYKTKLNLVMENIEITTGIIILLTWVGGFWLFFKANVGSKPRGNGVEP